MKVLKFGGGCLKDATSIKKMLGILENYNQDIIIVISAFGKLTNLLENFLLSKTGNLKHIVSFLKELMTELSLSDSDINTILSSVPLKDDYPAKVLSFGEQVSSDILSLYFKKKDLKHFLFDATSIIKTYDSGVTATVDLQQTTQLFNTMKSMFFYPILTQGYIAQFDGEEGRTITCLGREGSDYSAAIFGYLYCAQEVILFKDVDGVYDADPKKEKSAKLFSNLTYAQAFKICNNKHTIIHPKTINLLAEKSIPLSIRNFNNVAAPGTMIN